MAVALLILSITLFTPLVVFHRTLYERWKNKKFRKNGIEADALLLSMKSTGMYKNMLPQVKLQLQVYPKTGRNYVTEIYEVLHHNDLDRLQIGSFVRIKYNPFNHKEVKLMAPNHTISVGRFH